MSRRGHVRVVDGDSLSNIDEEERQSQPAFGQSSKGEKASKEAKTRENCITKVKYVKDIGLIATAFNGTIKFFDAFNFY